jgi:hypothetical protein
VHVAFDRGHILMPQQFLQTERVIAQYQVANGEGMAKNVRADALIGDAHPLPDALEEQRDPILGERQARLGEEEVVLVGASPLGQLLTTPPIDPDHPARWRGRPSRSIEQATPCHIMILPGSSCTSDSLSWQRIVVS